MTKPQPRKKEIRYLRISITDRCNLRCLYCMPEKGIPNIPHSEILNYEEIASVVAAMKEFGLTRVRLTGGEPFSRPDLLNLVVLLREHIAADQICITTNATLAEKFLKPLYLLGIRRINFSLDTLDPETYAFLTRGGRLGRVLQAIEKAVAIGFSHIKVNCLVAKGVNDAELPELAAASRDRWNVRFIGLNPVGEALSFGREHYLSIAEVKARLIPELGLVEAPESEVLGVSDGFGPARYYKLPGAMFNIGFIDPLRTGGCPECERYRLTPSGKLLPCLVSHIFYDIRSALRPRFDQAALKKMISDSMADKRCIVSERHSNPLGQRSFAGRECGCGCIQEELMSRIGG